MTVSQQEIIDKLHQLPSLPVIVQELIASFNDPDLDIAVLADKIERDQGLSAKVLRVANSSFYGLSRRVGSVQDALVVLGFDAIRSMALSAGMVHAFPNISGGYFDRGAYWQRSFRVATLARALDREFRQGGGLAFAAGMFHDIGQLILDLCIPQQYSALLQNQVESGVGLSEIERAELGFDHDHIGAELIRLWNFPPEIEQVVRCWSQPEPGAEPLVGVVHVAVLLENGLRGEALMASLPGHLRERMDWVCIEACLPSAEQLQASAVLTT